MRTRWGAPAHFEVTFGELHIDPPAQFAVKVLESPTRLAHQHWKRHCPRAGSSCPGQTGLKLAGLHAHCHGHMGTQSEHFGQVVAFASRHCLKLRATGAARKSSGLKYLALAYRHMLLTAHTLAQLLLRLALLHFGGSRRSADR